MRWLALLALLCAAPGCESALKGAGEQCFGTSECGAGLTCDFGQNPPVCADGQSGGGNLPDAAAGEPDAAAGEPDAAAGEPDAAAGEPDAAAGEPDAGLPDAGASDAMPADAAA